MASPTIAAVLAPVSLNGVQALSSHSHEAATDLLEQAHGIIAIIQSSLNDAADLRNANRDSEFTSLNERLPHAALSAVSTLIALANALTREG